MLQCYMETSYFFICYRKHCICKGISWFLLSYCFHRKWTPFLKRYCVMLQFTFCTLTGSSGKYSEQNKVKYSVFEWTSPMLAQTETLKFQEIGKYFPLRRLMRILCFVSISALLLLWAAAAFFSSHVFLWNALLFLFVKALVIQVALLCRNMFYCGVLSSSHLSLQLYRLWRLSELCSCGGRLGRRASSWL